ncbi:MAG TPA: hypothetical protein VFZ61_20405 [Polyangiales bacterium]
MTRGAMQDDPAQARRARTWQLLGLVFVTLPFLPAEFVPCADMPQHLSQLRLLAEAFSWLPRTVDASQLEPRLLAPNTLVYWPLLPLYLVFSAPLAGRLGLLLLLSCCVLSLNQLARRRGRVGAGTLLAVMLLFSHPTYWGFLNFLVGVPIFFWVLAEHLGSSQPLRPRREGLLFALGLVLLAWAHVMWTCAAAGIVVLDALVRRDLKRAALYLAGALPGLGAVLAWSHSVATERQQASFDVALHYGTPLLNRLSAAWLSRGLFGGISLRFELVAGACVLSYLCFGVYQAYQSRGKDMDASLLRAGALLCLVGVFGPAIYLNSIDLSQRFLPYGAMLLLIGVPRPPERLVEAAFASFALSFVVFTGVTWVRFNREDLSGLGPSLAALSQPKSVLGLNYRARAMHVAGSPFLQLFAYFQAEHGGEHNFSFAEHGSGVVVYKTARRRSWANNLEWHAERASAHDVAQFDCTLVNATSDLHAMFRKNTGLTPLVDEGFFRLYCRAK